MIRRDIQRFYISNYFFLLNRYPIIFFNQRKVLRLLRKEIVKLKSSIIRKYNRFYSIRRSSAPYVSGDSFRVLADHIFDNLLRIDPASVQCGDIVFVQTDYLDQFANEYLDNIHESFILVSHNSDHTVDDRFDLLLRSQKIYHWFAQNSLLSDTKITSIPIGLENRWWHNNGIVKDFDKISSALPRKINRILYGFNINNNEVERRLALKSLELCPVADQVNLHSSEYRKVLAEYAFVASPAGNGLDCHRTWEALYFKTIPIVRRSKFYDGFLNLPVFCINEWKELESISVQELEKDYNTLLSQINNTQYLWMSYWETLLKVCQQECRNDNRDK